MNNDQQLIWEAYLLQESYFDSWQLPDECEDWRDKYVDQNGVISASQEIFAELTLNGCKPAVLLHSDYDKALVARLKQAGLHEEIVPNAEIPLTTNPDLINYIIGNDPEWVKEAANAYRIMKTLNLKRSLQGLSPGEQKQLSQSHMEFGKSMGFGKYTKDINER